MNNKKRNDDKFFKILKDKINSLNTIRDITKIKFAGEVLKAEAELKNTAYFDGFSNHKKYIENIEVVKSDNKEEYVIKPREEDEKTALGSEIGTSKKSPQPLWGIEGRRLETVISNNMKNFTDSFNKEKSERERIKEIQKEIPEELLNIFRNIISEYGLENK